MCSAQLLLQRVQIFVQHLRLAERSSDLNPLLPEQPGSAAFVTLLATGLWHASMVWGATQGTDSDDAHCLRFSPARYVA